MWIAKFKLRHEGDLFTERTKKFNIEFYAYPLTHYSKNKKKYFLVNGFIEGENKNKFIEDLKKDVRIKKLEEKNNYVTLLIHYAEKEIKEADMETYYNPSIIHVEPVLCSKDGWEHWTIGSFEKEELMKTIRSAQENHNGKLISIINKKSDELFIVGIKPKISPMQKKVLELAFKEGYYSYPRKIEIEKIAKELKIAYSTCQEHLRKAEIALLPNMIKKL